MTPSDQGGGAVASGDAFRGRWSSLLALGLLWMLAFLAHGPVLQADFVNWDDDLHVLDNPKVQTPGAVGVREWLLTPELGYPVPVTMGSYALEQWLHGPGAEGFHAINLLLHLANMGWVWALARGGGLSRNAAFLATALFGLHPVVVEPVAWVSGRKDLLATFFVLAALAWLQALRRRGAEGMAGRWGVAGLLLLASLSKPVAALSPVVAWSMDARGRRGPWPLALLVAALLVGLTFVLETRVGALRGDSVLAGPITRVLAGLGWTGEHLFWPTNLLPKYLDPPSGPPPWRLGLGAALLLAGLVGLGWAWRRRSWSLPWWLLAGLAYGPVSGIVPLSRQVADTYLYLPLAGLALVAAQTLHRATGRLEPRTGARVAWPVSMLVALALGWASARQVPLWQDGVTLWASVWKRYPDSPQVCRNLGNAHLFGRRFQPFEAMAVYRHCIERLGQREFFLKNLALAAAWTGRPEVALPLLREALDARPEDPALRRFARRFGLDSGNPTKGVSGADGSLPREGIGLPRPGP